MSEIRITVGLDGSVEVDAVGFSGTDCLEATRPYEKDLGVVGSRKKKPEMLSGEGVSCNGGVGRPVRIRTGD